MIYRLYVIGNTTTQYIGSLYIYRYIYDISALYIHVDDISTLFVDDILALYIDHISVQFIDDI